MSMVKTTWWHSRNIDGSKREVDCCGCWNIETEAFVATCNECGEKRDLARLAHLHDGDPFFWQDLMSKGQSHDD